METKKTGFTLIELLVVIAIIAILMAILMPTLSRVKETAKRVVCSNQVKQIGVGITTYATDYQNRMPTYNSNKGNKPYELIHSYALYRSDADFVGSDGKLLGMKLALLYEGKYITDPKVFYCPSNIAPLYKYNSYCKPAPWGTLPQVFNAEDTPPHNQWVRMGYTYMPTDPRLSKDSMGTPWETAHTLDNLDAHLPYLTDLIRHLDQISHTRQGNHAVNALFKDGHVKLCNQQRVFDHPVWQEMESQAIPELTGNYRVFQLIAGRTLSATGN